MKKEWDEFEQLIAEILRENKDETLLEIPRSIREKILEIRKSSQNKFLDIF